MQRIIIWFEKIPLKKRYTLLGFFFGLLFPIVGTSIEILLNLKTIEPRNFFQLQSTTPVLWVIDTAPLVLMVIFRAIGTREEKLAVANQNLEAKVAERTRALEKSNQALEAENSERERAVKESDRQKKYFQTLIENSPAAVVLLDNEQKITHCNPAFEDLYGYNCTEITGKDIDKLISTKETEEEASTLTREVMNQRVHQISKRRKKDGELVDVELFGVPVFVNGERAGALAIYHDISVLVQARLAAEEANRSKSEFLANMSHEIRTPMNGIIGMLDIALDTPLSTEQKDYLTIALQSAESLLTLLNDILDYSKIEAKKLDLETVEFDLRNTVEGVAYTLANPAEEKGLELASLVPPALPINLLGDPSRLRQILINLTGNAIKFTENGEVIIRAEAVEESGERVKICFSVQDTGIGIKADRIDAIFERFTQADGSTTRKFGGTGLGLAISQHLVEAMGGKMSLASEYGKGSNFSFTLEFEKQAQKEGEADSAVTDLRGLNILIVDDNATNRVILMKMIEGFGARAYAVESGQEGLDALLVNRHSSKKPYDLVLLDMQMPEMDGEQTARAIFSDPRNKSLSVVVLTSMGRRGDAKRLGDLGCAGYLLKPIKQKMLFASLVAVMNERERKLPGTGRLVTRHLINEEKRRSQRILLAEDNLINQKVTVTMLEKVGHLIDIANNGKEALEMFKENQYNLVLMDVQMPLVDGFEAARRIRAWEAGNSHVPIIAMTAHAMKGDRERCLDAGMDDYISKPIDRRSLFTAVDRWGRASLSVDRSEEDKGDGTSPEQDYSILDKENKVDELLRPAPRILAGSRLKEQPPLDIASALPRFGDDRAFFDEMCADFFRSMPKSISEMRTALEKKDAVSLNRAAHNLKGMAATFSATKLTELSNVLEEVASKRDLTEADHLIISIEEEANIVSKYLLTIGIEI